jgi:hypothetical protein
MWPYHLSHSTSLLEVLIVFCHQQLKISTVPTLQQNSGGLSSFIYSVNLKSKKYADILILLFLSKKVKNEQVCNNENSPVFLQKGSGQASFLHIQKPVSTNTELYQPLAYIALSNPESNLLNFNYI